MAELVQQKTLRDAVDKMSMLDHHKLQGHRELRLAHLQLSIIASGYIWQEGDSGAAKVLPACLAVPWHGVSMLLGIQPVLCHPSLVLANWSVDSHGELHSLYNLPGGDHAEWFVTVTAEVELAFAVGLKALMQALTHAQNRNVDALVMDLQNIKHTVHEMKKTFSKMHEKLSAETFYDVLRPFLSGWGGDGSPLPDGVVYTGISAEPLKMTGGSAAQSSTLQCIDAVLGVRHGPDISSFLENMRNYMPPAHKEFIETIEEHSQVKQAVAESHDQQLTAAYNKCLEAVVDFRSYHVQIVTKYIVLMANRESRNKDYEALATRGTGGSMRSCAVSPAGDRIYLTNYFQNKLLTLTTDGSLISTFTDPELKWPIGVHVTPAGQVLVCGHKSDTVIQVDHKGRKKLATLASWKVGAINPLSVCYNTNMHQIIVGIQDNNMIIVMELQ